jgi:PD-(D/E)XK nuclease superfamily
LMPHPLALLGICFHSVMEAVQKGRVLGSDEASRGAARDLFDESAAKIHADAHPLLKTKFPSPEKMPFYNLFRERAAALAAEYCGRLDREEASSSAARSITAEARFSSADGLIVGRPDLIDLQQSEVIDYKTGLSAEDGWEVSEREARQLSLYVYLANESGLNLSRGTIVRGNGETATIEIAPDVAAAEGQRARAALTAYNTAVEDRSFFDLATPAPETCRMCPCIPVCEPFWQASDPTWQGVSGIQIEGTIVGLESTTVQGTPLVSLNVDASRGTLGAARISIEQIPIAWMTADGDRAPTAGDVIRVVDARLVNSEDPVVVRADRIMTSVWRLAPDNELLS